MASLTVTIGALTASVSADNAKATNILTQYAASINATGTNQEKLNAVVLALAEHMRAVARRQRENQAAVDAAANLKAELGSLTWE